MVQTFVDDKRLGPHPAGISLPILPDSFSELLRFLASETNAGKGMNGHTANIAGGDT